MGSCLKGILRNNNFQKTVLHFLLHILSGNIPLQMASFWVSSWALVPLHLSSFSHKLTGSITFCVDSHPIVVASSRDCMGWSLSMAHCLIVLASSSPRNALLPQLLHVGGNLHEEKFRITWGSFLFSQCIDNRISEWETLWMDFLLFYLGRKVSFVSIGGFASL